MTIEPKMQVYKNRDNKRPTIKQVADFDTQGVYESELTMNLHTGTHVDFPHHTLSDGATSESISIDRFIGRAIVLDLTHVSDHISESDLSVFDIEADDIVLLKTRSSLSEDFDFNFVYLDISGSHYLVAKGVRAVGTDALGIERNQPGHPTHDDLLSHGVMIIEGLRLKDVVPKRFQFVGLPLKMNHVEALPMRAILIDDN